MTSSNAAFHISEVEITAARAEEPEPNPIIPAADKLWAAYNYYGEKADSDLAQLNRDFPKGQQWQGGLISLSDQFEPFLSTERQRWYQIDRFVVADLRGVKLFDHLRAEHMHIRCLAEFRVAFQSFSDGLLTGMDWANVSVAGGSILACLSEKEFGPLLSNSDVDLFIWGLDAANANKKLEHIYAVIAKNAKDFDTSYTIERTAGAITFIPIGDLSGRKVQVVLRTYANPAAILAGFDLDQACVLFDGKQVWLSLRAIRAFKKGYTTTVGAISSSFAARIVKYATRGYGVLVLPDTTVRRDDALYKMAVTARLYESEVREQYYRLPWTGLGNFGHVFVAIKSGETVNWTHSFAALAGLAALWSLAYTTGRIAELMEEVGTASHIYGVYEGTESMSGFFQDDEWLETLETIRTWTIKRNMWRIKGPGLVKEPLRLLLFLPKTLRARIKADGDFPTLKRMRNSDILTDANDEEFEICLWTMNADQMWQPRGGMASVYHQFLLTASLLSAWTLWKVSCGAPWPTMFYGKCLHNAHVFSSNAALTRPGDFEDWTTY
ncbi:hypothetical protein CF326_g1943 [Tilletia indica]|nr:hypothetical protein CF326_g1943 [Tilletia indica]